MKFYSIHSLKSGMIIFIFIGILIYNSNLLLCQFEGYKYIKNYDPQVLEFEPQNWAIIQDKKGIIYVANQVGLLEFDGATWRKIDVPNKAVRSLAIGNDGTIYVGGRSEIGFLSPNEIGVLKYKSLMPFLSEEHRRFSPVWKIHANQDGIFFASYEFVFHWIPEEKKIEVLNPKHRFYNSFKCMGNIFIRDKNVGLCQIKSKNSELVMLPGGEKFALDNMKISMMVPFDDSKNLILIGTKFNGFFIYDKKKGGITKALVNKDIEKFVMENHLQHGIRLTNGEFALATLQGGLIIVDSKCQIRKHKFDRNYGLQDDSVKSVFEDIQGNLWLALDIGISKIEYASPLTIFDNKRSNLPGLVLSVHRHDVSQELFAGTTRGCFYRSASGKFKRISMMAQPCWSLLSVDHSLLAAVSGGVFQIKDNKEIRSVIRNNTSFVLHQSKNNRNRIWVGTNHGLISIIRNKENSLWKEEFRFDNIKQEIRTIIEDFEGNLWLGLLPTGILRIDIKKNKVNPRLITFRYDESHGLPPGEVHVFFTKESVCFGTDKGLYRFDEKKDSFVPDLKFGEEFANGTGNIWRLTQDLVGDIWFISKGYNYQAKLKSDNSYSVHLRTFLSFALPQVNDIYPDPNGDVIWYARNDGLIRFDNSIKEVENQSDFSAYIRRVLVNDKLLYDQYHCEVRKNKNSQQVYYPIIGYRERDIRFECAAPFFLAEGKPAIQYQFLLEGHDEDWSSWTNEHWKDYTYLDSGTYSFRVRAHNVFEAISREAVFQFRVLHPWYFTWWALLIYILAMLFILYLIVKWRSWRLHQEKLRLEKIIVERTKEINQKSQQLEKQTHLLQEQSEKLQEMDHVKSRFFANISHEFRTPLTLIMGPLEQMLADRQNNEQTNQLNMMMRNSQRLLHLINQLLDLSKLDSGKMTLQATHQNMIPFLKGLFDSFGFLAKQNNLNFQFKASEDEVIVFFDPEKIEKVFCNLLSNAIKFTPSGGDIIIATKMISPAESSFEWGGLEITVTDTGIGIPGNQLAHIFDRFYQAGFSSEHDQKGSGIGLALTKELVSLHNGTIEAKSIEGADDKKRGTQFIVRLPLSSQVNDEKVTLESIDSSNSEKLCFQVSEVYTIEKGNEQLNSQNKTEEKETESNLNNQDKNIILIVEDSADVRRYMREPLGKLYTVIEAVNGKEGIEKAKNTIPDLIISDIMMPEVDGYELCRTLKKDVTTSHIPIILLTAKASEENIVHGLETGADDYITKPFNTNILMARIKNLIDLRHQVQERLKRQMMLQPEEISVSSIDEEFLKEVQGTIEKNLSDSEFNVEGLSKQLYMSRATLYRKIHALSGESPNQFIRSYRLKRAAQLLKEHFGNVTEVAFEVGFASSAYFTKCFKERFHQLPSSYQLSEGGRSAS